MSKEQLLHIFDESACLTRRQMKDYVAGTMTNEESHAVEVHLNACPLCNDAVEGMFAQQEGNMADVMTELDSDFLKSHLGKHHPNIHLNTLGASQATNTHTSHSRKRGVKNNTRPFWRNISIAAILLLAIGLLWFSKFNREDVQSDRQIAMQTVSEPKLPEQELPKNKEDKVIEPTENVKKSTTPMTTKEVDAGIMNNAPVTAVAQSPVLNTAKDVPVTPTRADGTVNGRKRETTEEVVVTRYKAPLIDKYESTSKKETADEVEKMPTRSTESATATSPRSYYGNTVKNLDAAPSGRDNVSYTIDGVATVSAKDISKANMDKADALFEKGKYEPALRTYKKEIDSEDKSTRQKAALMSAKCYIQLGDTSNAQQLLQGIIHEGGPQKRAARKLLKELDDK